MRIFIILLAACALAQAQTEPITIYSSTAPSIGYIKLVSQDTLTLLWNGGTNDRHIKQSRYVPGETTLLGEPADLFPGYATNDVLEDVKQLDNGTLLFTFSAIHGNESPITKFAAGPAPYSFTPLYQSRWDGPQCWFTCFDFTNTGIYVALNGDVFVAGSENSYFDIGGAREVDSRPLVIRLSSGNYSDQTEFSTDDYFFYLSFPHVIYSGDDTMTVLTNGGFSPNSVLISWNLNDEFAVASVDTLPCNIFSYVDGATLVLPSGRILAVNDFGMFEITRDGECNQIGGFAGNSGHSSFATHPDYGIVEITSTYSWEDARAIFVSRLDTNGIEVATSGFAYWQINDNLLSTPTGWITDDGTIHIVWTEEPRWPNQGYQIKYVSLDWETPLATPEQKTPVIPSDLSLSSYPNPFNSTVTIQYELPTAGHVMLTAFDLHGRRVATLNDEFASAGSREVHWSPENLASGVYFITLHAPFAQTTHKILYLK